MKISIRGSSLTNHKPPSRLSGCTRSRVAAIRQFAVAILQSQLRENLARSFSFSAGSARPQPGRRDSTADARIQNPSSNSETTDRSQRLSVLM